MEVINKSLGVVETPEGTRNVTILCCHCGTAFSASTTGTNICLKCLSSQVDITGGITKEGILEFCRKCNRYLRPPWVHADLESKQLLDICLKKIRGLNKVKLIDAAFIWTEPHSRRVKVKLTVQSEVMNNAIIQQSVVSEFTINYLQCPDCKKEFTPHTWKAKVQVRQKVDHKKTFYFLEQLILKHGMHDKMIKVEEVIGGVDFFFKEKGHAIKFVEFLQTLFPVKAKQSKQLISQNEQNSTYNFTFSFSIDIPRVCKDDLVILKSKFAGSLGGCGKLLLCTKVASVIQFIDIVNMKVLEITGQQYFQHEGDMKIIPSKGNLSEFMVFDVDYPESKNQSLSFVQSKFKASTASIGRVTDWENFEVKTHLGDVLTDGSSVMAYDLTSMSLSGENDDLVSLGNLPDVIIVKKIYPERKKNKKRIWKLKHLAKEERGQNHIHKANVQKDRDEKDYQDFLLDVEVDPELRAHMNLYKDEKVIKELELKPEGHEETQSEIGSETQAVTKKTHKKKAKGKKGKKNADNEEKEDEVKEEEKVEEKQSGNKKNVEGGIKIEELLNDLNLEDEKEVKVGGKLQEEEEHVEEDDHDHGIETEEVETN